MSKFKRIFLDVDGVITNWSKSICEKLKVEYPKNTTFPYQRWLAEKINVNDIFPHTDTFEFWESLEKFPWSDRLVNLVNDTGIEWRFLTKPMENPKLTKRQKRQKDKKKREKMKRGLKSEPYQKSKLFLTT